MKISLILFSGLFLSPCLTSSLAQDPGALDASWQNGGKLNFTLSDGFNSTVDAANFGNDHFVIIGDGQVLTKMDRDGNLDNNFGVSGVVEVAEFYPSEVECWDNKIYIAGTENGDIMVKRYLSDGSPDNTFGTNSLSIIIEPVNSQIVYDMKIDVFGNIILAGRTATSGDHDFMIARLDPNGALDTTFGSGGFSYPIASASNDEIWSIGFQPDGKIILGGESFQGINNIAIARLNANGSLDPTFGTNGFFFKAINNRSSFTNRVYVNFIGEIFVTGQYDNVSNYNMYVLKLDSNGALDNTFSGDGIYTTLNATSGRDMSYEGDGRLIVFGTAFENIDQQDNFYFLALNVNGVPDNSWIVNGEVSYDILSDDDRANILLPDISDGALYAFGFTRNDQGDSFLSAIRLCNGSLSCSSSTCPTDLNNDNLINTADLSFLLANYGCTSDCQGDVNGDSFVDTADLLAILGVFGESCSQ